jgi:hypothetical protein
MKKEKKREKEKNRNKGRVKKKELNNRTDPGEKDKYPRNCNKRQIPLRNPEPPKTQTIKQRKYSVENVARTHRK